MSEYDPIKSGDYIELSTGERYSFGFICRMSDFGYPDDPPFDLDFVKSLPAYKQTTDAEKARLKAHFNKIKVWTI